MAAPIDIASTERARTEALRTLVPHRSRGRAEQLLASLEARTALPDDAVWTIRDDRGLVAAALVVPMPGRTATITVTPPGGRASLHHVADLLEAVVAAVDRWEVDLLQALLSPEHEAIRRAHHRAGFTDLAELITMSTTLRRGRPPCLPPGIRLEHAPNAALAAALAATYEETLDCPGLRGLRKVPDVIKGHRSGGTVYDDLWGCVYDNQRPIGCLLATLAGDMADLAYLGLEPAARGRGIAEPLLKTAMHTARMRGARTMRLAVDTLNTPARRLYARCGFLSRVRHLAVIRPARVSQVGASEPPMSTER